MCEKPEQAAPPDPAAPENTLYEACVSEYMGLRRAGAPFLVACGITAVHMYVALSGGAGMPES